MGAGVAVAFFFAGADDVLGDGAVEALLVVGLEGLLHDAVFARVEGENRHTAARGEGGVQFFHKFIENLVLVVHIDTQGLEDTGTAFFRELGAGGRLLFRAVARLFFLSAAGRIWAGRCRNKRKV